ncbi:hypothetical protein [Moorena producens]|uniref:hypothetical protein n=1 Tax=Moorena producens TaxID=1155739 RepID=UPI003C7520EE
MANIEVNDIKPAGADLFEDSQSFLTELKDDEFNKIVGGWTFIGKCGVGNTFIGKCRLSNTFISKCGYGF